MAFLMQPRERKASLPYSYMNQANPGTPTSTANGSSAAPRTPQMIRCSTCSFFVPLLELSEHVCQNAHPQQQQQQQRQRQPSNGLQRGPPAPLHVNITQSSNYSYNNARGPSPSSGSQTQSPHSNSSLSFNSSPASSPANLSPGHYSPQYAADNEAERPGLSRSSSAQSNLSTISASNNNAGIGARLPFFEKYQRVYGNNNNISKSPSSPPYLNNNNNYSSNSGSDTSIPRSTSSSTQIPSPGLAKSPVSPGWSSQGGVSQQGQRKEYFQSSTSPPHNQQQQDRVRAMGAVAPKQQIQPSLSGLQHYQHQQQPHSRQHSGETNTSEASRDREDHYIDDAASSSRHSDYLDYLEQTPETSPDFADSPVFAGPRAQLDRKTDDRVANQEIVNEEGEDDDEDDFIDSYPTPQPHFEGRFGGLVISDDHDTAPEQDVAIAPKTAPLLSTSALPYHRYGSRQQQQQQTQQTQTPQLRGMQVSQSTPVNLSKLAAAGETDEKASIAPSLSLNDGRKRRSRTGNHTANGHLPHHYQRSQYGKTRQVQKPDGAGSNALDDLLNSMNRDSLLDEKAPSSPTPEQAVEACTSCKKQLTTDALKRDEQTFCAECYTALYLPKCRKCKKAIEGKAIGSGDGKVKGKFHAACFSCFECSAPFPSGDFYVYEQRPYCARHYHSLNGTLCANPACTEEGIEGPCVSLVGEEGGHGGRYHPSCFVCSNPNCDILLDQYHYILSGLPYCEQHAHELEQEPSSPSHYESDTDAYYNVSYPNNPMNDFSRRRSISANGVPQTVAPTHIEGSISALRKNAHSPTYMRGAVSRNNSNDGIAHGQRSQINRNNAGPPPSASANQRYGARRAEKRRTIVSRI